MEQLLCHLFWDYIFQNEKMDLNKIKRLLWTSIHGLTYTIPFLFITQGISKLLIICLNHIIIDRYRLVTYLIRFKNWNFSETGFNKNTPVWFSTWLMIIVDNTIHLTINFLCI